MTDLSKLTKKQLIALCEENDLVTDGTKIDLMDRLNDYSKSHKVGLDEDPVEDPVEEPVAVVEMPKTSARERVRIAWRMAQGGGHPPAMLWEEMTTELALGRKTEDDIRAVFADL